MAEQADQLLKRPLYVYDLPPELLADLQVKQGLQSPHDVQTGTQEVGANDVSNTAASPSARISAENGQTATASASCALCRAAFESVSDQRHHNKSDWHSYNLKQRLSNKPSVSEGEFEKLLEDLDESISGSDSSSSDDGSDDGDTKLSSLLKRQAKLQEADASENNDAFRKKNRGLKRGGGGPPLTWFSSSKLPENTSLGIYNALFTETERNQTDVVGTLLKKQLQTSQGKPRVKTDSNGAPVQVADPGPTVLICMIGGGHFAAMIVALTPEITKNKGFTERQAKTVAQKTFHRYTTRRKQGGAQSSNDNAKGNAKSAGAAIRRANELALEQDIRSLLKEWSSMIDKCELLFVRASGTTNRRVLFGPYDGQILKTDDPRLRTIPFGTRRATQQECMRAFVELTRVKVSHVDVAALAAVEAAQKKAEEQKAKSAATSSPKAKANSKSVSPEDEADMFHTSQLQQFVRRSKVPALLSYLSDNNLSPNFKFLSTNPQANHHASTPLHLAASLNIPLIVTALLTRAGADPTELNGDGKPAFDLAGDRATRDAFRVARSELGESKWNWTDAHVPAALSKSEAEQRAKAEKRQEADEESKRRQAEMTRLTQEAAGREATKPAGRVLGSGVEFTASEKREQEARGLTPEMRVQLERERRARAAEERMKRLAGK